MINPFEIHHPARITVAGTSGTGKTMWTLNLIRHRTKIFKPYAPSVYIFITNINNHGFLNFQMM